MNIQYRFLNAVVDLHIKTAGKSHDELICQFVGHGSDPHLPARHISNVHALSQKGCS